MGLTTIHSKNDLVTECSKEPRTGQILWINDISYRIYEYIYMRFGTVCICKKDRLCGLVVRVLAMERKCVVFPVSYEMNLYMLCRRK
jgi:hypothetical protein